MGTSQWHHVYSGGSNTSAARFFPIMGNANNGGQGNDPENTAQIPWAAAGKFTSAQINLGTAPGVGKSWRLQLMVNGVASAIDVTISDAATTGSITTDVTIAAGDKVDWKCTPSGTPAATTFRIFTEWLPTTDDEFVYGGVFGFASDTTTANQFQPLFRNNEDATLTTENLGKSVSVAPIAGSITAFYVIIDNAPGAGKSWDFSLRLNGADVGSLLNIADAAVAGNQTGLSQAVAVQDRLTFHLVARNSTATAMFPAWSVIFKPTTTGQFVLSGSSTLNNTTASFWALEGGNSNFDSDWTTEAPAQIVVPATLTLIAMVYRITTAPGAAKQWRMATRIGGVDGNLVIAAGNVTDGTDTGNTDALTAGQLLAIGVTVTAGASGPTGMGAHSWAIGIGPSASPVAATMVIMTADAASPSMTITIGVTTTMLPMTAGAAMPSMVSPALAALMAVMTATALMPDLATELYKIWEPWRRQIDPADWPGTRPVYLEIHGAGLGGGDDFNAYLWNETDGLKITDSDVTITATVPTRGRSIAFSLATGSKIYHIQFLAGHPMYDAVVIVDREP